MVRSDGYGVYFIFKSMEQGSTFRVTVPKCPPPTPIAASSPTNAHYYFYIRDEVLGPMGMRVASFFPFQTTYYLERELTRAQTGYRKNDNAFLAVEHRA
jgi:hypothetical protein